MYMTWHQINGYAYLVHWGDLLLWSGREHGFYPPHHPPLLPPVFSMLVSQISSPWKCREEEGRGRLYTYFSLMKEYPWAEHLTSPSKRGVGALLSVSAFNHKRASIYAYSDSIPLMQTITYSGTNGGFEVKS